MIASPIKRHGISIWSACRSSCGALIGYLFVKIVAAC